MPRRFGDASLWFGVAISMGLGASLAKCSTRISRRRARLPLLGRHCRTLAQACVLVSGNIQPMSSPRWSDVQDAWEPDGALRDVYVHGTSEAEWQSVVDAIR